MDKERMKESIKLLEKANEILNAENIEEECDDGEAILCSLGGIISDTYDLLEQL